MTIQKPKTLPPTSYDRRKCICDVIKTSNVGMFQHEIFQKLDQSICRMDVDQLRLQLDAMLNLNFVTKSRAEGRNGPRWSLTQKGFNAYPDEQNPIKNEEIYLNATTNKDKKDESMDSGFKDRDASTGGISGINATEAAANPGSDNNVPSGNKEEIQAFLEGKDSFFVLSESNEVEAALAVIAKVFRQSAAKPEAPEVVDKELNLNTLKKLSAIMSPDIKEQLEYIYSIIEQLPEAA